MTKVRLPLLVERTVSELKASRLELASSHEQKIRSAMSEAGVEISCGKGCSNCCHQPFGISILEGVLLYKYLSENGQWTQRLKAKLTESKNLVSGLSINVWKMSNIPCPLLKDRVCSVYDARPLHCRTMYAISEPKYCHPHRLDNNNTQMLPRVDVLDSFYGVEKKLLKKHGLIGLLMPLAEAVLLGEMVVTGEIDLADTDVKAFNDIRKALE